MNRFIEYAENNTEKILVNKGLFCSMVASMLAIAVNQDATQDEIKHLFDECLIGQSNETHLEIAEAICDLVNICGGRL